MLEDCHVGTQAAPDRAELEADHARADPPTTSARPECAAHPSFGEDRLFIEARRATRAGSSRWRPITSRDQRVAACRRPPRSRSPCHPLHERTATVEEVIFRAVTGTEAVVVLLHDARLARKHFCDIDTQAANAYP